MTARERANELAAAGNNCCQSVLLAFAEELKLPYEDARRLAAAFGCGVCCGNVCGAITGSAMALGYKFEGDPDKAWDALDVVMKGFLERHGTLLCKDILGYNIAEGDNYQRALDNEDFLYKCRPAILDAAELLDGVMKSL